MALPAIPSEAGNVELLVSATRGFNYLFSNDLYHAKEHFAGGDDPYHLLGQGVCAFMEAALGMETGLLAEASRCLSLSEAGSRRQMKNVVKSQAKRRFTPGLEFEILNADAVVLLGLTNALSESYMGYLQCMYSLNSAHSKFSKLYKTVFPNGLDAYTTPSATPAPSRKSSTLSLHSSLSSYTSSTAAVATTSSTSKSFFSRFTSSSLSISSNSNTNSPPSDAEELPPDGPIEDLIISGTAFGYGLFNLVFSLLPKKVQGVVGLLGFKYDRKLALRALAVSAGKSDVHSVFSGLVLMTYYGVVLLLSGYQADEAHIIKQYKAIVTSIEARFPQGALWILNRAKIMRMSYDPEGAIKVLRDGLRPDRPHSFAQADTLLVFELAWTLLGQRRYQEAADMFIKVTELNSWSHGTYYFLAAGCYISLGNTTKAQALLDVVPDLIDKKKISGKDLPTEVLIKKKLAFYQEKQKRRGGDPKLWAQAIKISIAEELGLFWNTHARIERRLARAHIREWSALTPPRPLSIADAATPIPPVSPVVPTSARPGRAPRPMFGFSHALQPMPLSANLHRSGSSSSIADGAKGLIAGSSEGNLNELPDIDTPDEHAIRHLLIGMCERTAGEYAAARESLKAACELQSEIKVSTWVGGVAMFELAVLDLKEVEAGEMEAGVGAFGEGGAKGVHEAVRRLTEWDKATKAAGKKLEAAMALARSEVDLSSRLDSRVSMLRDEIAAKREALGI
ncbi:hypothetical protein E4T56_gene5106 [Termitomyces sp. T112]|nr:hypothetical protein E4T56_gene5106 [Termitomyces sp. T112]KAH0583353.1 hypothetical protein H2248_008983 [Termitomyces sp. 'cryptogamus']